MTGLHLIALLLVGLIPALARASSETVQGAGRSAQSPPAVGLPRCVNDGAEVAKIQDAIKANSKSEFKYKGYREALASDSDAHLMARLIYSETIAANAPRATVKSHR